MQRISKSDGYHHGWQCEVLGDCEHHYCPKHRLLWSDCETIKEGWEGDGDVVNGLHKVLEVGDCPLCEQESRRRESERLRTEWEAYQAFEKEHGHGWFVLNGCEICERGAKEVRS